MNNKARSDVSWVLFKINSLSFKAKAYYKYCNHYNSVNQVNNPRVYLGSLEATSQA